jgi:hypothetical protein
VVADPALVAAELGELAGELVAIDRSSGGRGRGRPQATAMRLGGAAEHRDAGGGAGAVQRAVVPASLPRAATGTERGIELAAGRSAGS